MNGKGVILINLGTPDAPTPEAVGVYLREFLMDGYVINLPKPLRWFLVNIMIVPRRKYQSAEAYRKVQMPGGSPLLVHTRALAEEVATRLASDGDRYLVEYAMRYGNPSIASALKKLCVQDVSEILVLPLYPQYAESSFETAVLETKKRAAELGCADRLKFISPFYDSPEFLNAFGARVVADLKSHPVEHVLFSFHGLPERHVTRFHPNHCLQRSDCCDQLSEINRNCYRAQCFYMVRAIAKQAGLEASGYTISFQSRLGRARWIEPNTEDVLKNLAHLGVKEIAVTCPSFVADCLETVEEIEMRGRKIFIDAGGNDLRLIPALNADPMWVETIVNWIRGAGRSKLFQQF
jgi:protoporphyrin/coproporphyrin ferrochelatase